MASAACPPTSLFHGTRLHVGPMASTTHSANVQYWHTQRQNAALPFSNILTHFIDGSLVDKADLSTNNIGTSILLFIITF